MGLRGQPCFRPVTAWKQGDSPDEVRTDMGTLLYSACAAASQAVSTPRAASFCQSCSLGTRSYACLKSTKQPHSCWPLRRCWSWSARSTSAACAVPRWRLKPNCPAALKLLASAQSEMRCSRMAACSLAAMVPMAMPRRLLQLVGSPPGLRMGAMMLSASGVASR